MRVIINLKSGRSYYLHESQTLVCSTSALAFYSSDIGECANAIARWWAAPDSQSMGVKSIEITNRLL